jgi:hypothetical protein
VFLSVKKDAAAGVDGETWEHYGENLEMNLRDLSPRVPPENLEISERMRLIPPS